MMDGGGGGGGDRDDRVGDGLKSDDGDEDKNKYGGFVLLKTVIKPVANSFIPKVRIKYLFSPIKQMQIYAIL